MEIRNFGRCPPPTVDAPTLGDSLSVGGSGLPRNRAGNPIKVPPTSPIKAPYQGASDFRSPIPRRLSRAPGWVCAGSCGPRGRLGREPMTGIGLAAADVRARLRATVCCLARAREPGRGGAETGVPILGGSRAPARGSCYDGPSERSGVHARIWACMLRCVTRRSWRQWCLLERAPGRPRAVHFVLGGGRACVGG